VRSLTRIVGSAVRVVVAVLAGVALVVLTAAEVEAGADLWAAPPHDLNTVISNITKWLVGLLVSLATLFFTVGGVRRLLAGGDPTEVAKANDTLKNAAFGYGLAALAPVLAAIVKALVGG
jgi:hypothetical protein